MAEPVLARLRNGPATRQLRTESNRQDSKSRELHLVRLLDTGQGGVPCSESYSVARMRITNRRLNHERSIMLGNQLYGVQAAAKMLGVNARTIQYALKRFKRGRRLPVGTTGRFVLMLTKQDVLFLDKNLQRKVGRPCKSKEKQEAKKEV